MLSRMSSETTTSADAWPLTGTGIDWAVTINVGSGPGGSAHRQASMARWAQDARRARRPAIVFAQEVTSGWVDAWRHEGYQVIYGVSKGWKIKSTLVVREGLTVTALTDADYPTLGYHGDYVAAARWHRPQGEVLLASVHASPQEADLKRYPWPAEAVKPRNGGGDPRYPGGRLWDSDLLLATLKILAKDSVLIAAGDFNEARNYDVVNGRQQGTWGEEYFKRVEQTGLSSYTWERWQQTERPTHGALQLDHVLHDERAQALLTGPEPQLDPAWDVPGHQLSDHTALWFPIRTT